MFLHSLERKEEMSNALNLIKSRLDLYGIDPNLEAYDAYNQKSDAIDDILNSLGWYNEERASKVKKRILGEAPPNLPFLIRQAQVSPVQLQASEQCLKA